MLELGLVGAARCEPVAAESAPKQRDVPAHLGAGRAQGEARAQGSGYYYKRWAVRRCRANKVRVEVGVGVIGWGLG